MNILVVLINGKTELRSFGLGFTNYENPFYLFGENFLQLSDSDNFGFDLLNAVFEANEVFIHSFIFLFKHLKGTIQVKLC